MNMIEKVAMAMYAQYDWGIQNNMKLVMHSTAKAAIAAMREPSEEMIKYVQGETFEHVRERAKIIYRAMIDAALKE